MASHIDPPGRHGGPPLAGGIPPREEFGALMRATMQLLLRIDRPYLALCLRQFELMALAVWPETDPPPR